jgi:hypothetical protein
MYDKFYIRTFKWRHLSKTIKFEPRLFQANSVPRSDQAVNGAGQVRKAPRPQYNTLAELSQVKKQEALQKHKEWEIKKAARMGVPVEALRNCPGSPGSAGSLGGRRRSRTRRNVGNDKKKKT